jgi:hypothetical protein
MEVHPSAPLLSRVKSWQLVGLGIAGWLTFYSMALITWSGAWSGCSNLVGNARGGCFAITMTLAGLETKRYRRGGATLGISGAVDPLEWVNGISTQQLNMTLAKVIRGYSFKTEIPHPLESKMGFGVRAVKEGRTVVFETARWTEPVIDLPHVQSTEASRREILADLAVIVCAGKPDEESQKFVHKHSLQFLVGDELKSLIEKQKPPTPEPPALG